MSTTVRKRLTLRNKGTLELFILVLPLVLYYILFHYWPMYGVQIAFRNYIPTKGFLGSDWVGLKYFIQFFSTPDAWKFIRNTLAVSFSSLLVFPVPIILALMLNLVINLRFKKIVQTSIFVPHFVSVIVAVGMFKLFGGLNGGLFNNIIKLFGGNEINFFGVAKLWVPLYILIGLWQSAGWGTIVYTGALTSISPELYESAVMDGANKFQRILYIDIPGIMPTIVLMLILKIGHLMSVGFEQAYLMQTPLNLGVSEVISTYVYKMGIQNSQFSFSSAIGLFNSLINFTLLIGANYISKRVTEESLW